ATLGARYGPIPARLITAERGDTLRLRASAQGVAVLYKPIDTRILERFIATLGQPAANLSIGRNPRHPA
ncbi:MAG TPA: hypothetical protein GX700_10155, partial [Paracoccus sp.]|nr:hypothetical protein [Paracoccus sp. (in: a-proteobacteria)]